MFARGRFRRHSRCYPSLHAAVAEMFQAWSVVPVTLSDADATHLVGVCSACRRAADDPLKVLQLGGVSALMSVDGRPLYYRSKFAHCTVDCIVRATIDCAKLLTMPCLVFLAGPKVYGVSKRFLEELVDLFRADSVVAAKSTAPGRARRGGDEHLPRGNTSARTGAGKGRRKKGGRKGESEVIDTP